MTESIVQFGRVSEATNTKTQTRSYKINEVHNELYENSDPFQGESKGAHRLTLRSRVRSGNNSQAVQSFLKRKINQNLSKIKETNQKSDNNDQEAQLTIVIEDEPLVPRWSARL